MDLSLLWFVCSPSLAVVFVLSRGGLRRWKADEMKDEEANEFHFSSSLSVLFSELPRSLRLTLTLVWRAATLLARSSHR